MTSRDCDMIFIMRKTAAPLPQNQQLKIAGKSTLNPLQGAP